jgi:hypothetical protein
MGAAQGCVLQLMQDVGGDHGTHHFVTGDGLLSFRPLSDGEKARAADVVRMWAEGVAHPHDADHPRIAELHAEAAKQLPHVKEFYSNIADALDGGAVAAGAIEHVDSRLPEEREAEASKLPQFVRDWCTGLGDDMRKKANAPQSEAWRDLRSRH